MLSVYWKASDVFRRSVAQKRKTKQIPFLYILKQTFLLQSTLLLAKPNRKFQQIQAENLKNHALHYFKSHAE